MNTNAYVLILINILNNNVSEGKPDRKDVKITAVTRDRQQFRSWNSSYFHLSAFQFSSALTSHPFSIDSPVALYLLFSDLTLLRGQVGNDLVCTRMCHFCEQCHRMISFGLWRASPWQKRTLINRIRCQIKW